MNGIEEVAAALRQSRAFRDLRIDGEPAQRQAAVDLARVAVEAQADFERRAWKAVLRTKSEERGRTLIASMLAAKAR